ncbi:D-glycero-alpha-D-manno-heptose-1,7-bisphosphate 7-phosphatase [Niabella aquatica]
MHHAVFIDKDGTCIKNVPYNVDPRRIELGKGADFFMKLIGACGYKKILVTNQPGIALGYYSEAAFLASVVAIEKAAEAKFDYVCYCPHHPEGHVAPYNKNCDCCKPQPGMLLKMAAAAEIDLRNSWMIGDILDDVEAGNRAGCQTILLDNGGETEWRTGNWRVPDFVVPDLFEATTVILKNMVYEHFSQKEHRAV